MPPHRCLALDIAALHRRDARTTLALNRRISPLSMLHSIFPSTSLPCTDTRATSVFHGHNYSCTRRGCCAFHLPTSHNFIFVVLHLCRRSHIIFPQQCCLAQTQEPHRSSASTNIIPSHSAAAVLSLCHHFTTFIFASELRSMRRRCERQRRCECEGVAKGEGLEMSPHPTGCLALAQSFDCSVGSVVPKAGVRLLLSHRAVYYSGAGDRVMCPCCKV